MIIETAKELDYGVLQIGENYIEIKTIGGIFVDDLENNNFNIELQLKNAKFKRFKVSESVKNIIIESWLKETERRYNEGLRCSIPKVNERDTLSTVLKEHISKCFEELNLKELIEKELV